MTRAGRALSGTQPSRAAAGAATLSTERLHLRPLAASDAPQLHALWTDPDVRQYLWDGAVIPPEQTAAIVAESERLFALNGHGLWAARHSTDRELVGFGGFWYFRDPPELELLYGVARSHWRRGLATEIARAMIDYGAKVLGLGVIRATTDPPNVASARVLEKLGFLLTRRATVAALDTLFYELRT